MQSRHSTVIISNDFTAFDLLAYQVYEYASVIEQLIMAKFGNPGGMTLKLRIITVMWSFIIGEILP